ncbi:MAG: aminotransferase class V-fold PLP-dependent enzyme, partial [Chlorobi bacterium]|nr:aminotransferase class V-fold PLP-dependent enzyme [Chlorobiota bacterium]
MISRRNFLKDAAIAGIAAGVFLKQDALARITNALNEIPSDVPANQIASDEKFWSQIRAAFEIDKTVINFNNGGVSPAPESVQNALKEYIDQTNLLPAYNLWRVLEPQKENVREKLAQSFGCNKEEIAFTRNASEALEIVQLGMELEPGDEVITTTQDYHRMLTAFDQRERRDKIKVVKISYPVPLTDFDELLEKFEKAITPKTKAILVSHVVYLTGQIMPIQKISRLAHKHGIKLICDGAQSFNVFPFKQKDLECDYFGTSLHKWTMAPIGTGFLYVKKNLIENLWPLMAAPEKRKNNIRKFEELGTHPAANHNAVAEALEFNEKIGLERKAERLRFLHSRWIERLKDFDNVKFNVNINDKTQFCNLVNVNIEGTNVRKLAKYLFDKHKIFVIPIRHKQFEGIRVSVNVYSSIKETEYFAEVMTSAAKGEIKE